MASNCSFHILISSQCILMMESVLRNKIGNCKHTKFFKDIWLGEQRLLDTFPRLYELEMDKDSSIAKKGWMTNGIVMASLYSRRRRT